MKDHHLSVRSPAPRQSDDALVVTMQRYRAILNSAMDAIITMDAAGNLLEFNPSAERMFGYRFDEVVGQPVSELIIPPELREKHRSSLARYLSAGASTMLGRLIETSALRRDGTEFPVELFIQRIGGMEPPQFTGFIRDITERRLAADEARANDRRGAVQREALIALTGSAAICTDPSGAVVREITESAARTLGVARVSIWRYNNDRTVIQCVDLYELAEERHSSGLELAGATYPAYFRALAEKSVIAADDAKHDARTSEFAEDYLRPLGIGAMLDAPIHHCGAMAGVLCHEHVGSPRQWRSDEKAFVLAIANLVSLTLEIGERQRAEAILKETKERLERAVSAGEIGLWDWDLTTDTVQYSPEFRRHIGHEADELPAAILEWQTRIHPCDAEATRRKVDDYLSGSASGLVMEYRFRHKDGSYRNILARGSKLVGEDGRPVRLLGSHVDVTEQTTLQAQFLQSQKMETVGQLAAGVAHDFNNLLTVINATADMAMSELRDEDPLKADLKQILEAGRRGAALTQQLLSISRKQIQTPETLNLNVVILEMRQMLQRLIGESINLVFVPAENLGDVKADRTQIEQVIMNLAVNARDAMPRGGVLTIETRNAVLDEAYAAQHTSVQPGPHVLVAVTDTGVGIDASTRARIFEPFFTTKAPGKGTGLGLSTAYGIVKQSGGSVWVYSEIGLGTTFRIYLPLVADEMQGVAAPPTELASETILVVEDDALLRKLAQRILSSAGYTVLTAEDGPEALVALERHAARVDLLLTDVILPGIGGRDLAHRIQTLRPGTKVIYTSGYTDDALVQHGVVDEGVSFLGKPYTSKDLLDKVRMTLDA